MHSKQRDIVAAILVLMLQIVMTYCTDIDDVCYSGNADKLPLMIRIFCDQLGSLENNVDTEILLSQYNPDDLEDSFSRSTRSYTRPGMFYGMRIQRGGNYIRFGRSYDRSERGDGHYVRFGRSVTSPVNQAVNQNPFTNQNTAAMTQKLVKRSVEGSNAFMRFGKRAFKGGDNDKDQRKRFMRFGKRPNGGALTDAFTADKKFMRFGKRDDGTQFMRFGKSNGAAKFGGTDSTFKRYMQQQVKYPGTFLPKAFIIQRPANNDLDSQDDLTLADLDIPINTEEEPFLSMKRGGANDKDTDESGEKRFMRFGRSKLFDSFGDNDAFPVDGGSGEKRFMRFGKRVNGGESSQIIDNEDQDPNKRFMRFGKRRSAIDETEAADRAGIRIKRSLDDMTPPDYRLSKSENDENDNRDTYMESMESMAAERMEPNVAVNELENMYNSIPVLRLPLNNDNGIDSDSAKDKEAMYNSIPLLSFNHDNQDERLNPSTIQETQLLTSGALAPEQSAYALEPERQLTRMTLRNNYGKQSDYSGDSNALTNYNKLNKLQHHFDRPFKRQDEILEPLQTQS